MFPQSHKIISQILSNYIVLFGIEDESLVIKAFPKKENYQTTSPFATSSFTSYTSVDALPIGQKLARRK
jgi:hypothetical protein